LPDIGSLFYALVNGWYLGEWADYSSCLADAAESQYILATVSGQYKGEIDFTRGGEGKFTNGFSTRMGLCFPKQCTTEDVRTYTEELITGYATGVGWTNVSVSYYAASKNDQETSSSVTSGAIAFAVILALGLGLAVLGILVENSTIGDRKDLKLQDKAELLYQASKFRRLTQYDAILLQRKSP